MEKWEEKLEESRDVGGKAGGKRGGGRKNWRFAASAPQDQPPKTQVLQKLELKFSENSSFSTILEPLPGQDDPKTQVLIAGPGRPQNSSFADTWAQVLRILRF